MPSHPIEIDYNRVRQAASLGLAVTNSSLAAALGVSVSTVQRRMGNAEADREPDEQFLQAVQEGKNLLLGRVTSLLLDQAENGSTSACKVLLENILQTGKAASKIDADVRVQAPSFRIILQTVGEVSGGGRVIEHEQAILES